MASKNELFILVLSFIKGTIKKIISMPTKEYIGSILAFKIVEIGVPNIGLIFNIFPCFNANTVNNISGMDA